MNLLQNYINLSVLENLLGSVKDKNNPFSLEAVVAMDESESFPERACNILNDWGYNDYYIPKACRGKLKDFDISMMMMRLIARRDLTIAIGHGKTFLGALPIWIGGNCDQQKYLAELIKTGNPVSLGLTEKNHGSDLVANEVLANYIDDKYIINGRKWLINNATRSRLIALLAKTNLNATSLRSHSILLIDKEKLLSGSYLPLPKIKTHGIHGADISGIEFKNSMVNSDSLIGGDGQGMEITLKTLQVSRVMCCSLSLGALDTALRTTTKFALERVLYNDKIININHVRETLLGAYTDILINEVLSLCLVRCLHLFPEKMSIYAPIVKYFVPRRTDFQIQELSRILGARYYLREEHDFGIFQKVMRDNLLVGLFDGSTLVNAQHICVQLTTIARRDFNKKVLDQSLLQKLFNLDENLPDVMLERLKISLQGEDILLASLELLQEIIKENDILYSSILELLSIKKQFLDSIMSLNSLGEKLSLVSENKVYEYCKLIAACCCINFYYYNKNLLTSVDLEVLKICLDKLICELANKEYAINNEVLLSNLVEKYQNNKLFSFINLDVL